MKCIIANKWHKYREQVNYFVYFLSREKKNKTECFSRTTVENTIYASERHTLGFLLLYHTDLIVHTVIEAIQELICLVTLVNLTSKTIMNWSFYNHGLMNLQLN